MRALIIALMLMVPITASAGIWDDIVGAVKGHVEDVEGRLAEDQYVKGKVIRSGEFREDDRGQDLLHRGGGAVNIVRNDGKRYIQLEANFWTTPGPDYHVYVSAVRGISDEGDFYRAKTIELGKLTKGSGASYYEIPKGTRVGSVTIWCKKFGEFIASADLH